MQADTERMVVRPPFRNALSGINAATAGLRTTANNIANAGTPGFKQSRDSLGAAGSVQTAAVETSNVDLTEQLLKMIEYSLQFEVQARVIRTANENSEAITGMLGRRGSR